MSKKDFIDRTLLKLRRQYSANETISALNKKLKELEYENGVLQSEVSEMEYLRNELSKLESKLKNTETRLNDLLKSNEKKIVLKRENDELKEYVSHLENKLY